MTRSTAGRVEGKVALVTGAARGQGRAYAARLAEEGADVIVLDICDSLPDFVAYESATPADLKETVRLVESYDRRAIELQCDVRDLDGMRNGVAGAVEQLGGRLDVAVANAGIGHFVTWDEITPKMFDDVLDINLKGVWHTLTTAAPYMIEQNGGSIIVVSSAAALRIQPFMTHYVASKWAVTGLAKAFAAELAQHNVRVNTLHPTGVNTAMTQGGNMQEEIARAKAKNPRPSEFLFSNLLDVRRADPEDLASAMLYLASDEARYVTAHSMTVDLGITMH